MHTLTKIFIVLQALLSIFILALVVPFAMNRDHWQGEAQKLNGAVQQAEQNLSQEQMKHSATEAANANDLEAAVNTITTLQQEIANLNLQLIDVRSRVAEAEIAATEARAQLDTLSATNSTMSKIIEEQGGEITARRNESLETQKRSIELEDSLRDSLLQLQVALHGVRILKEELADAKAGGGVDDGTDTGDVGPPPVPSPEVSGKILQIEEDDSCTRYGVVDLGSRDGLAENMRFILSRDKDFVGYLVITTVDINRSVGRIDLEQPAGVQVSDTVSGGID